jgi:hypothetical protein
MQKSYSFSPLLLFAFFLAACTPPQTPASLPLPTATLAPSSTPSAKPTLTPRLTFPPTPIPTPTPEPTATPDIPEGTVEMRDGGLMQYTGGEWVAIDLAGRVVEPNGEKLAVVWKVGSAEVRAEVGGSWCSDQRVW